MSAKGAGTVMVLAVYVVCDCPAHGDEAGSRRGREKPSFRKKYVDKIAESDTALATDHPREFVEAENPVQAMTLDKVAACVEARIAVTPAQAERKQGARLGSAQDLLYLVIPTRFVHLTMLGPWIAAPGKNTLGVQRGRRPFPFGHGRE